MTARKHFIFSALHSMQASIEILARYCWQDRTYKAFVYQPGLFSNPRGHPVPKAIARADSPTKQVYAE